MKSMWKDFWESIVLSFKYRHIFVEDVFDEVSSEEHWSIGKLIFLIVSVLALDIGVC